MVAQITQGYGVRLDPIAQAVDAGVRKPAPGQDTVPAMPQDRIDLSPAAQARLAADTDLAAQLRDAAARTLEALKRNQSREFTARGVEITDPDVSMSGRSVMNLRGIAPQAVNIKPAS